VGSQTKHDDQVENRAMLNLSLGSNVFYLPASFSITPAVAILAAFYFNLIHLTTGRESNDSPTKSDMSAETRAFRHPRTLNKRTYNQSRRRTVPASLRLLFILSDNFRQRRP